MLLSLRLSLPFLQIEHYHPREVQYLYTIRWSFTGCGKRSPFRSRTRLAWSVWVVLQPIHPRSVDSLGSIGNLNQQARWRRLWRIQIQEYLTATIQNLMVLLRHIKEQIAALGKTQAKQAKNTKYLPLENLLFSLKEILTMFVASWFRSQGT